MANVKPLRNKILIVGANGLLGQKLVRAFQKGFEVFGIGRQERPQLDDGAFQYVKCDITQRSEVRAAVQSIGPGAIVNAAAYTNVDGCEVHKEQCWRVNVRAVEHLAQATRTLDAFLVHISTDYVFDGNEGNYSETSKPHPMSYYGRAKLASENAVIAAGIECAVIRTMVLYGFGKDTNPNFATWLVEQLSAGNSVRIVEDQYGHPTLVDDLALAIRRIVELRRKGTYHVAGSECVNRYDFALRLAEIFGFDRGLIQKIRTSELSQKAVRPLNSSFNLEKSRRELGIELRGVDKGLTAFKEQMASIRF